jgi:ABC-type multidrug transport system fused ATPase/permease subunit
MISSIVASQFAGRTLLVIAHRLATIMSCDNALVLEGGALVEAGVPRALAAEPSSRLAALIAAAK